MKNSSRDTKAGNRKIDILKKILGKYSLIWVTPICYLIVSFFSCYYDGTELSVFFSKIPDYLSEGLGMGFAMHWVFKLFPTSKKTKGVDSKKGDC